MAGARGICSSCGNERAVRNGKMREHLSGPIGEPCPGSHKPPHRMTQSQDAPKTVGPFDNLSDEVKEAFSKAVLEYEAPDICEEGRMKFLRELGFPLPSQEREIVVDITLQVPGDDFESDEWGSWLSQEYLTKVKDKIQALIGDFGVVTDVY